METFSALLAICAGNSPVAGEFPTQRPVMRSFDVFFDLRLNKRLSKQSGRWWFETPSRPLCHCITSLSWQYPLRIDRLLRQLAFEFRYRFVWIDFHFNCVVLSFDLISWPSHSKNLQKQRHYSGLCCDVIAYVIAVKSVSIYIICHSLPMR